MTRAWLLSLGALSTRRSVAVPKFADGSLDVTYASAEAITVPELVPSAAAPGNVPRAVSGTTAEIANKPKRRAERSRPERPGTRGQSRLRRNMKPGHYRRYGWDMPRARAVEFRKFVMAVLQGNFAWRRQATSPQVIAVS